MAHCTKQLLSDGIEDQKAVSGLKVIHCRSKSVVLAPKNCEYIALSYLWGSPQLEASLSKRLDFPASIEDAVAVTLALGLEYLWVDRYCIDQENDAEKHDQIQQIGLIYSRAQMTIVVAASSDPLHGLPGVGCRALSVRKHARVNQNISLCRYFPTSPAELKYSKWGTRVIM
ncbi:heterokaryon incompatibility protein-domain-containing protein [Clohesyomyces aquaticus]|uniref:Heterokaryon incompatibility protein-domain-containing protein n=1 Tax=Clohesyomyces aquaticus TaxID=1231657 RepID=A0A1Y1Y6W4_9PLEO|nr:heterokaryon incompatibility protein-domain-containing protein [Clohesyomyces aquaticus]